jgi:uncharacterized protein YhaN
MLIKKLYLKGFGKFHDEEVYLNDGINLIYGLNEAGKSTMHQFIEGMLFGFFKLNIKNKKYTDLYDRYLPWNAMDGYEGRMIIEMEGNLYRIERNFLKRHDGVNVYNELTGEDITEKMSYNSVTKLPDLSSFIGLTETAFRNTISIGQLKARTEKELASELKDYITNVSSTKDQDLSVENVVKHLDNQLEKIGTEKRSQSPLGKVVTKIESLKEELKDRVLVENIIREKRHLLKQLQDKEIELNHNKLVLEQDLYKIIQIELKNKVEKLRDIENQIGNLNDQLIDIEAYKDLDLNQLETACRLNDHLMMLENQKKDLQLELDNLIKKIETQKVQLEDLGISSEGKDFLDTLDAITFDYESYLENQYKRDELAAHIKSLEIEISQLAHKVNSSITMDYERYESLEERKRRSYEEQNRLVKEVDEERKNQLQQKQWLFYGISGMLGLMGVFLLLVLPSTINMYSAFLSWSIGIIVFVLAFKMNGEISKIQQAISVVIEEQQACEREINTIKEEQNKILKVYEIQDAFGLKHLKETIFKLELNIQELNKNLIIKKREFEQLDDKIRSLSEHILTAIHIYMPDETVITKEKVEQIKFLARKTQQVLQEEEYLMKQKDLIKVKIDSHIEKVNEKKSELENLLGLLKVDDVKDLQQVKAYKMEYDQLFKEKRNKENLYKELIGGDTLEALELKIDSNLKMEDYHMVIDGKEVLERQLKSFQEDQVQMTKQISGIETQLSDLVSSVRSLDEIETELKDEVERKKDFDKKIQALQIAKSTISKIAADIHRDFAPQLNQAANEIIENITEGKYNKIRVNEEMDMLVEDQRHNKFVSVEQLSNGTIDQMYFALRAGVLDLIKENKNYPLILDDVFIQYDDTRLDRILNWLSQQSKQILLFTCQNREKMSLNKQGIKYHSIEL